MALTKAQKKVVFDNLESVTQGAQSMVFVNFRGLKVAQANEVRRKLKAEGVSYIVAKKTITRKVLEKKGIEGTMPELTGELGIAFGADLIAPAREIYDFAKKYKDNLGVLGGVFEGKFMTKDEMISIASIPSQKTLYAMFANVINSPIQGFVMALDQIAQKKTA